MAELTQASNNRVSLTQIIELGVQKTYHDLTVLAELLPRKTDFERKVEIVNFAERTRQLFLRLLALVKWAGGASKIEQCMDIVALLDKQALLFINTADNMVNIARTTLVQARLPSFQLPCAVEVLTLGTYSRMPTCVRDRIVPPDPITLEEKKSTLARLDHIIEQRLAISKIHPSMRNLRVEYGRVIFHVENEFDLKLTLRGDSPNLPWCVLGLDLLVEDAETGEGKDLVHPFQIKQMEHIIQRRMNESQVPLVDIFTKLHNFCLSLQIEVLHDQIERLMRDRLASYVKVKDHVPGQKLAITYWKSNCVLQIQIDHQETSTLPLRLSHQPELIVENVREEERNKDIFKPGNVSIEQLIANTIQQRAVIKLNQLASELKEKKYGKCTIYGAPSLLHVCCLDPCAPSEELIISLDLHGQYLAHVPQYEKDCPLAENIQESLNGNKSKLGTYFDQLKIWLLTKRCMTTIDYLSVTATKSLPLGTRANHGPKLDDKVPRLFFQFNKYNHYYLMAEFSTSETDPFSVDTKYSLLTTEPVSSITGDGLDIVDSTSDTVDCSVRRDLVVVENALELDVGKIVAASYCYETSAHDRSLAFNNTANMYYLSTTSNSCNKKSSAKEDVDMDCGDLERANLKNLTCLKQPVLLVTELPLLISFCEERLAFLALEKELRDRNFKFGVSHSEASGTSYCITFSRIPNLNNNKSSPIMMTTYSNGLRQDALVMMINLHEKPQSSKIWHCSYIFKDCPIVTESSKEQSAKRFVYTPYESPLINSMMVSKFLEDIMVDWSSMAHLYDIVKDFALELKSDPQLEQTIILKSFNYKKLVILYGGDNDSDDKRKSCHYGLTIFWRPNERKFHLIFSVVGGKPFSLNPHSFMASHIKHSFNQHKSIRTLVNNLNLTLRPLLYLHTQFPSYSFIGFYPSKPAAAVNSYSLIPKSTTRFALVYRNWASLDIKIEEDGTLMISDGSYSKFDRQRTLEDLNHISCFYLLMSRTQQAHATSYLMSFDEFKSVFQASRFESHLGLNYMIDNIIRKTATFANVIALSPLPKHSGQYLKSSAITYTSELQVHYKFTWDFSRGTLQMSASPQNPQDWWQNDMDVLERYFALRACIYPYKSDPFMCLARVLFYFPKALMREILQVLKLELLPDKSDASVHFDINFCPLIPASTPLITSTSTGWPTPCPLSKCTLFVIMLTKRSYNQLQLQQQQQSTTNSTTTTQLPQNAPFCYLPLTYDPDTNIIALFPNKLPQPPAHITNINGHLRKINDQFHASGNQSKIVFHAIRQLTTIPNLLIM